jgi:hypothetical protein
MARLPAAVNGGDADSPELARACCRGRPPRIIVVAMGCPRIVVIAAIAELVLGCSSERRGAPAPGPLAEPADEPTTSAPRTSAPSVTTERPPCGSGALELIQRIAPEGASPGLGARLAFAGDRLLLPDTDAAGGTGRLYLYERDAGGLLREAARQDAEAPDGTRWFAHVVAMSGAVMLACDQGIGETDRSVLRWIERAGDRLVTKASLVEPRPEGMCGAVVTDGHLVLVGASEADAGRGAILRVERDGGALVVAGRFEAPAGVSAYDGFGARALALCDGVIVAGADGAFGDGDVGGAVFVGLGGDDPSVLRYQGRELLFGTSIAVGGDLVAASVNEGSRSRVVVFERRGGEWVRIATLDPPESPERSVFGDTLALAGGLLVVGDPAVGAHYNRRDVHHESECALAARARAHRARLGGLLRG